VGRVYGTTRAEPRPSDGDGRAALTATLEEVAAEHPQVVLLGGPGSGKSWLLRNHARLLIGQQLDRLSIDDPSIPEGLLVPILVRADEFAQQLDEANGDVWSALSAVVAEASSGRVSTDMRQELQRWLREAMVFDTQAPPAAMTVLVDAFDERPALRPGQPDRLRDALNLLAKSAHVRLVLCSRVVGYHSPFDHGIASETVHVQPFGLPQIERFIDAWYGDAHASAAELTTLVRGTSLLTLAEVPLLLSFLCLLGPQGALGRRVVLYESVLQRLLDRPWERRTPQLRSREATVSRRVLLGVVAGVMSTDRWRDRISFQELLEVVSAHCRTHSAWSTPERDASAELLQLGSVLVPTGPEHDSWVWVHGTLHEFCLADHLARQEAMGAGSAVRALRPHLWYDQDWHETISLCGGLLPNPRPLLDAVCSEPNDVFYAMLLLAGQVLAETSDPVVFDDHQVVDRIRRLLTSSVVHDFEEALAVATRLGSPLLDGYRALADAAPIWWQSVALTAAAAPFNRAALERLSQLARDDDHPLVRQRAVAALGQFGPATAETIGRLARDDDDPLVREAAIRALGQLGPIGAKVVRDVAETDDDPSVRHHAAAVLGQLGDRTLAAELLQDLIHAADDDSVDDIVRRMSAVGSLGELGLPAAHVLGGLARDSSDPFVSLEAAKTLVRLGDRAAAVAALSGLARTPGSPVRHEAAEELAVLGERSTATAVLSDVARADHDPTRRQAAATALGRLAPDGVAVLHEVARDDANLSVRQHAGGVLADLGERDAAVEVLTEVARAEHVSSADAQARVAAAEALGRLGRREVAIEVLGELARGPVSLAWVSFRAAEALTQLGELELPMDVMSELCRTAPDPSLRWRAARGLGQLGEIPMAVAVLDELARNSPEPAQALEKLGETGLAARALAAQADRTRGWATRYEARKALEQLAQRAPTTVMDALQELAADDLSPQHYEVAATLAPVVRQVDPAGWDDRRAQLQRLARWSERQLSTGEPPSRSLT
jgi:HEAT repeat protein